MSKGYNGFVHKAAVSVTTSATALLTAAEQSTLGMQGVFILPASDIYVGGAGVTAANGAILCPGGVTTEIPHTRGPLYGITASGSVSTRVTIGVG